MHILVHMLAQLILGLVSSLEHALFQFKQPSRYSVVVGACPSRKRHPLDELRTALTAGVGTASGRNDNLPVSSSSPDRVIPRLLCLTMHKRDRQITQK